MFSLGEAARLTKVHKTTLQRAIKSGRLSATRTDTGAYAIDPAELHRVFPIPPQAAAGATDGATGPATPDEVADASRATLEAQIAGLKEVGELLRAQLADTQGERDRWRAVAERLTLAPPVQAQQSQSQGWWKRWRRAV